MFVILVAIQHAPEGSALRIFTDSQCCIAAIAKGVCKNYHLNLMCDIFWKTARKRRITPILHYVESEKNPADAPSRFY